MGFSETKHPCGRMDSLYGRTSLRFHKWEPLHRACACTITPRDCAITKSNPGCSLLPSCRCTPLHVPSHDPCAPAVLHASSRWDELLSAQIEVSGVRPHAPACATTRGPKLSIMGPQRRRMDHKGKQVASNKKEKMRTPPTRASPRLAALRAPLAIPSPPAALQPQEILPTNQENREATNTEIPRTIKIRKTARISVKPIQGRFASRLAERITPFKATSKEKVLIVLSSDDELENNIEAPTTEEVGTEEDPEELPKEEEEEEEDPEELPKEESQDLWDLTEPSTSS
ncbi:hypothetical protein PIB30_060238 [Stylosanthes scabra]|uniref:Uncharacterized protein n=1 Tax=Stylosanthes scabra TaxID=79078 RepID=A0ABU6XJ36_9FABA|nr:hypothetical protein [Stylosanthes scabra]